MPIIRQGSLFDIQELYDLEPTHRFESVFRAIDTQPMLEVERIPTIKDLIKRLKNDYIFRLDCEFLFSDPVPSEASYSRIITKLSASDVLTDMQERIIHQAISEGFIDDDTLAIDATHIEARDRAPAKEKKSKPKPKKRGRKTKAEKEQWLKEQAEHEAQKPLYEKTIADLLNVPLDDLWSKAPQDPHWGIKKNSESKNVFWYGYKGQFAVGARSQYILTSLFTSGNLHDQTERM